MRYCRTIRSYEQDSQSQLGTEQVGVAVKSDLCPGGTTSAEPRLERISSLKLFLGFIQFLQATAGIVL
jgi:hypothetical protein